MLVARPYTDFDGPPKIISEVRKSRGSNPFDFRPRLTGDLLVKIGIEKKWWPRRASVRNGQLQLSGVQSESGPTALRLPLRHLSLRAGALPNSLSLCKGQIVVLTLQTADEQSFDVWVKTIAIELIRQTPLEHVKYLDIFALISCWRPKAIDEEKDCNSNYLDPAEPPCTACTSDSSNEETKIENLFKKCQNPENYVPVREKLVLFESLCTLGRKVRSSEDVSCRVAGGTKRARSMHDLSVLTQHNAVREICKYFEVKKDEENKHGTIARFNRSDSQLNNVKKPF